MSVTLRGNSAQILETEKQAIEAALIRVGIAAKHNTQRIIREKDILDTEQLHNTIDYNVHVNKQSVDIGSPKNYAIFNELGTIKMAARPFLHPALLDNMGEYKGIVAKVLGDKFSVSVRG